MDKTSKSGFEFVNEVGVHSNNTILASPTHTAPYYPEMISFDEGFQVTQLPMLTTNQCGLHPAQLMIKSQLTR